MGHARGREDGWIPVARASELCAAIPGAELALLDGAGHLVQEDAPELLLERLTPFLRAGLGAYLAWLAAGERRLGAARSRSSFAASGAERLPDADALFVLAAGGIGFTWEADVHWLYKRAQLDAALLGSASGHRIRLVRLVAAQRAPAVA